MTDRAAKVSKLASLLFTHCIDPHKERVSRTGRVLPTKSLRHRQTREMLFWTRDLKGERVFTEAIVKDSLLEVVKQHSLELPATPGFSVTRWAKEEAALMHPILTRSRKSTANPSKEAPSTPAMDMDTADTQPWNVMDPDLDPNEDRQAFQHSSFQFVFD